MLLLLTSNHNAECFRYSTCNQNPPEGEDFVTTYVFEEATIDCVQHRDGYVGPDYIG